MEKDPDETYNLADDPRYAQVKSEMQEKLKKFQRRTWDGWILKWDYE